MAIFEGFSGVEGMVAWISKTTLCPAYPKAIVPKALKNPNIFPASVENLLP